MNAQALQTQPEPAKGEVVQVGGASLMEVISRAAADPSTDVDKLERLLGMYERITANDAKAAFHAAMNAAQEEMRPIAADANNPQTKSKYASYAALDRAIRPIYTKHGLSVSFDTADGAPAEHVRVLGKISHSAGHHERPHLDMPADGKGAKGGDVMTKTHAIGAAITYGKRYLLGMIFNLAVGDDNDGNSNGGSAREAGPAAQAAIAALNQCNTVADIKAWRGKNQAAIDAMDDSDRGHVVRAANDRVRRVQEPGQ